MRRDVRVDLGGRSYDVVIGRGVLEDAAAGMAAMLRRPLAAVVMDETVRDLHLERMKSALGAHRIEVRPVVITPGEEASCRWSSNAATKSSPSAAAWSVISPASRRRSTCAASTSSRSRPRS
jgi:3-dehydroquinate synthetase